MGSKASREMKRRHGPPVAGTCERKTRPYGTEVIDQVPLTLEDVLHPEPGDVRPAINSFWAANGKRPARTATTTPHR